MRGANRKSWARDLRRWTPAVAAGCIALTAGAARADDISVEQAGRLIFVRGGAADDSIVLSRPGDGILRVASSGMSTTVEGAQFLDLEITGRASLYLQLGDGANEVFVDSLPSLGRLVVLGGDAADTLTLRGSDLPAGVTFVGGEGDDRVALAAGASLRGELVATLGDGDDLCTVTNAEVGREVVLDLGDGTDTVAFGGATLRSALDIRGGAGADSVTLAATSLRRAARVDLGDGTDSLELSGASDFGGAVRYLAGQDDDSLLISGGPTFRRLVTLDLGDDDDTADIADASFLAALRIDLGDGEDTASLSLFLAEGRMTLLGGGGDDRVDLDGASPYVLGSAGGRLDGGVGRDTLSGAAAASGTVIRFEARP